ncbi:MAG: hypothetical protein CVU56_13105 [Deltaproteobacteria bacterium HGW-Deltaproteobacteria-14]|nr:MAG: hypothetical protein CVU56_13105 [Deltaproteobacteria bacterium HGW-Deltaproteobacteria-14]
MALGGFGLWHALGFMDTFNTTPPDAALWSPPPAQVTPTTETRRVVVAVVDGLRLDRAELLGFPADVGARCVLDAQLPSYSRPNYVALLTGAPPWLSGVRTNDYVGETHLETIFDVAAGAGWRIEAVADGTDWWGELFPHAFGAGSHFVPQDQFDPWIATWAPGPGSLSLVHIVKADDVAHEEGVGSAYDAAVVAAGAQLRALWARLDPAHDTLFVTSDHGHIDRGGHGGPEQVVIETPLFVVGAGASSVREGCHGPNTDLAATIAALLGLPPPKASLGRVIWPVLDPARVDMESAVARTSRQQGALLSRLPLPPQPPAEGAGLVGGPGRSKLPVAVRPYAGERPVEFFPIALAIGLWLALLLALLYITRRAKLTDTPVWPFVIRGVAYLVAYVGIVLGVEPTLSFSAVWLRGPWIMHMTALTVAAAILAWALTWVLNNHLRQRPQRAAGWVLLMSALPFLIAAGVHGSLSGGPELGEPHAAFGLLVGDFALLGGALTSLLLLAFDQLRRIRGTAEVANI